MNPNCPFKRIQKLSGKDQYKLKGFLNLFEHIDVMITEKDGTSETLNLKGKAGKFTIRMEAAS